MVVVVWLSPLLSLVLVLTVINWSMVMMYRLDSMIVWEVTNVIRVMVRQVWSLLDYCFVEFYRLNIVSVIMLVVQFRMVTCMLPFVINSMHRQFLFERIAVIVIPFTTVVIIATFFVDPISDRQVVKTHSMF